MGYQKVKNTLSNCAPESAYEYASCGHREGGFVVNRRCNSGTSKHEWQQESGGAIWGRIAPMHTLATLFAQSVDWLLEQCGSRLHNVKGAIQHG